MGVPPALKLSLSYTHITGTCNDCPYTKLSLLHINMPKLNCPVPGCSRKGRDGYSAQKRVNIHLRGPSHSISLEKGKGGDMEALRQRQERDFRAWCQGHGHPADTPLFPASDEDEEEDDLGRDSDDLNTDAGFTKSTTGQGTS